MRMRRMLATLVAMVGLAAGGVSLAAPSMASGNPYVEAWHTGNTVGNNTGPDGYLNDNPGAFQSQNPNYIGKVDGPNCWPFTCGNGANNYFNGHNVYIVYQTGTSYCWSVYGYYARYTTDCGTSHPYSLWVQTDAHNGQPWPWRGWANVGSTDAASGSGRYLGDPSPGATLTLSAWTSATPNLQTFQVYYK